MLIPTASHLVVPRAVKGQVAPQSQGVKCPGMQLIHLLFHILQRDAAHPAHRVAEIPADNLRVNADCFENPGTLIGLDGTDSHFGGYLYDTMQDCIVVVIHRRIIILIQHMVIDQFPDALLRQIGVHRAGAVSQQRGKMMHFPGLSGFQNQRHPGPLLRPHQVLVQSRNRQQGRNGHMVFIHPPVRKDQDIHTVPVRPVHFHEQPFNGALQACIFIISNGNHFHPEAFLLHILDFQQIRVCQNRIVHPKHIAVPGIFLQNIALRTDVHGGGSHYLLPNGIDGRIGHLGKKLLKIMEQRMDRPAQHRKRHIHSHGRDGLRPVLCHGQDACLQLIIGIAEGFLHLLPFFAGIFRHTLIRYGQILQKYQVIVQPLPIRLPGSIFFLQLLIGNHLALKGVHQQHLAGTQTLFRPYFGRLNIQHPHLGRQDKRVVIGNQITGRPQAVSIQYGSHDIPVGKQDGCRSVPGLHHGRIILVEIPLCLGHGFIVSPGLWNGNHHRQRQLHTAHHQEFQGIVQHGGIGAGFADGRQHLVHLAL